MSHEFNEYEHEPRARASASRNMGLPGKSIGADLIDGPEAVPPGAFRDGRAFQPGWEVF